MHITYVNHTRFPTEKAHGYQVASVCHALTKLGHDVTLLTPTVWNAIEEEPHAYYGIPHSFDVLQLEHFDALNSSWVPGFLAFAVSMRSYQRALARFFASRAESPHSAERPDLIYVRSPFLLPALLHTGIPVILELHSLPRIRQGTFVKQCNRCRRVVCLTSLMKKELIAWGVDKDQIVVEGDAVDLGRFDHPLPAYEAKEQWKLPVTAPIIGYIGSLVTHDTIEKGVRELLDAFVILRDRKIPFLGWIVGGPAEWIETYKKYAEEKGIARLVRFHGSAPASEVPSMLLACDILVYPAPKSDHPYFRRDTSPLKLFEYMAAERPIVAADLPPLRDVVDSSMVEFCKPGEGSSLAHALMWTLSHADDARHKARKAFAAVSEHTWEKRMKRIVG